MLSKQAKVEQERHTLVEFTCSTSENHTPDLSKQWHNNMLSIKPGPMEALAEALETAAHRTHLCVMSRWYRAGLYCTLYTASNPVVWDRPILNTVQ